MSVAVLLSLLEALTLAPMRCSQMLTTGKETIVGNAMNRFMNSLSRNYRSVLTLCLEHRWKVIGAAMIVFVTSLFILGGIRKEFVPPQDQSRFMINIQTPMGSSIGLPTTSAKSGCSQKRPEVERCCNVRRLPGRLVNLGTFNVTMRIRQNGPRPRPTRRPSQQEFMA